MTLTFLYDTVCSITTLKHKLYYRHKALLVKDFVTFLFVDKKDVVALRPHLFSGDRQKRWG